MYEGMVGGASVERRVVAQGGGSKEKDNSEERAEAFDAEAGDLSERLAVGLSKLGAAIRHGARRDAFASGLSATQAEIVALLWRHDGLGTLVSVARELGIGLPTVSEAVGALVRKGLVTKGRSGKDARALSLRLTAKGKSAASKLASWPDHLIAALDALREDQKLALLDIVTTLIRRLQEQGAIPVARMCLTCVYFRPNAHPDPERPHHCAFVDAPFGDRLIRLDCPDHVPVS
ncbi:MAG: MarR family transcriptional regulator [Acidimicrobiia bacterium]